MKKNYLNLVLLLCVNINIFAQDYKLIKLDSIPVYEIINKDFNIVLDSFINEEMQYDYYNANVTFYLRVLNIDDTTPCRNCIELSSGNDLKEKPLTIPLDFRDKLWGICYYKTHLFIMYGNVSIDDRIMVKTEKYTPIRIVKYSYSDEDLMEDDTYFPTIWHVIFKDNNFYIGYKSRMRDYR